MKNTLLVIAVLLVGGCENDKQPEEESSTKPVKKLTLEEKVVGAYKSDIDGSVHRHILLEHSRYNEYINGKIQLNESVWKLVNGEIHIIGEYSAEVWRINPDRSITVVAEVADGKRTDLPKDKQITYERIK